MQMIIQFIQIYVPLKNACAVEPLLDYFSDIKGWMALNFLHFNENMAEFITFCPGSRTNACHVDLDSLPPYQSR